MTLFSLDERRARIRAHRQAIRDAEQRLHTIGEELFDLAVQIALTGPLYSWNEAQPIGAFADLDAVLVGVQDGRIVALLQLREAVGTAIEHVREDTK